MKKTTTGVPLPTVHLNGTSRESLMEDYRSALHLANELHYALRRPLHARDYYVQGPGAYTQAADALGEHLDALGRIRQYLEEHCEHLAMEAGR